MIKHLSLLLVSILLMSTVLVFGFSASTASAVVTENPQCLKSGSFLGFPYWYKYLDVVVEHDATSDIDICSAKMKGIKDVWLVVAACVELLIRVASMIATGFVIYGGVTYITSQGAPDKSKKAQGTIINAVIGLVMTVVATAVVSYVAGRF